MERPEDHLEMTTVNQAFSNSVLPPTMEKERMILACLSNKWEWCAVMVINFSDFVDTQGYQMPKDIQWSISDQADSLMDS